jgi:hypothetical protein
MTSIVKKKNDSLDPTAEDAAWDNRQLGADENFVRVSTQGAEARLDEGLGLQMISMRLLPFTNTIWYLAAVPAVRLFLIRMAKSSPSTLLATPKMQIPNSVTE